MQFRGRWLKPNVCFRRIASDARTHSLCERQNLDHAPTQRLCARCRAPQKNPDYPTDGREPRRQRALWLVVSATSLFSWQHSGGSFREQKPCQYAVKNDISALFLMCVNKWSYSDWISKYKRYISYRVHSRHIACILTTVAVSPLNVNTHRQTQIPPCLHFLQVKTDLVFQITVLLPCLCSLCKNTKLTELESNIA